jgi:hypothetical protein
MCEDGGISSKERWMTPYARAAGAHSLSGSALVRLAREILDRGMSFRFAASGFSMSPLIRDGDVITLAPYREASCRTGSVVAFIQPGTGRLVVHRVVGQSRNECRIRGDNIRGAGEAIPHSCIIGQVVRVERGGNPVRFGIGSERIIIALLSRWGWFPYCTGAARAACAVVRRFS